tara:strand:+ start:8341 stop:8526 length:186 start_codon:yes stop_codon:yes gene_type:complete
MAVPVVDYFLCTGCGTCEVICPKVFELGDDGKSYVIDENSCNSCDCKEAADSCPESAITFE